MMFKKARLATSTLAGSGSARPWAAAAAVGIVLLALGIGRKANAEVSSPGDEAFRNTWPCWRGPRADGTAGEIPPASALVDKPEDARLVWTSEAWIPPSGRSHMGKFVTGFASPCVSEGRVFLFWYEGDGKVVDEKVLKEGTRRRGATEEWGRKIASVAANEIVLCVDANTGQTLWNTVVGKGPNLQGSGSGKLGGHYSMAAADGKAFAIGTNARAYCLDAATGKVLWTAPTGPTEKRERELEKAVAAGTLQEGAFGRIGGGNRHNRMPNGCPAYADGVVWVFDTAFDAETGKVLWTGQHGNSMPSPVVWNCEGKQYFISGGGVCVEPKSGKVLWKVRGGSGSTPAVGEGYLVVDAAHRCYRITPMQAELLWELEKGFDTDMNSSSVIHDGYLYANTSHPGGHRREGAKYGGAANHVCIELATGKEICRIGASSNSGSLIAFGPWVIQEGVFRPSVSLLRSDQDTLRS